MHHRDLELLRVIVSVALHVMWDRTGHMTINIPLRQYDKVPHGVSAIIRGMTPAGDLATVTHGPPGVTPQRGTAPGEPRRTSCRGDRKSNSEAALSTRTV